MNVSSEFSKYAQEYGNYDLIQKKVIAKLLSHVTHKPRKILDVGCGSGGLLRAIDWEYDSFCGIDFAQGMLELHPKSPKIELLYADFNDERLFEAMEPRRFDAIFSASALQWACDLQKVFTSLQRLDAPVALAIFTSNTFKTLNKTASLESILQSAQEIEMIAKRFFHAHCEVVNYQLAFESTRDMFRYIKKSGVSGSRKILNYKQSKRLLEEYPLSYLEFEVIFIYSYKIDAICYFN